MSSNLNRSAAMKTKRRQFFRNLSLGVGAASVLPHRLLAAASPKASPNFLSGQPSMRLGMVTYNLGADWDVATLIRHCEEAGFEGVELRTTHAHKVEVALSPDDRARVRQRFQESKVRLMGLGSAFDYHTPDQDKLRKDIAATKDYIVLAHDVGASGVKVRPNGLPPEVPVPKTLEQIGRALRELGEFGEGHGIEIRLEVHGTGTSLLPNIKTIMDAADHRNVGVCWNSNQSDLEGDGFEHNFNLVRDRIRSVHMRDLFLEEYPFRVLLTKLNECKFSGFCLAEIPPSKDPVRVMKYYRALWLAYQGLL